MSLLVNLQEAFNTTFLMRFTFGVIVYWVVGILTKGVFEPLQSHIGKVLFARVNNRLQKLQQYANQTCTKLDDIIITNISNNSDILNRIINRDDLSPTDQQLYRQLVAESYRLPILFEKLGITDGE